MNIIKILLFPFRVLYDFIKFLIKDTIDDIKFIRKVGKDEGGFLRKLGYELKNIDYSEVKKELRKSWTWFLIIFLAFVMGIYLGGKYAEMKCNEIIFENFIRNNPLYAYKQIDYDKPFENGSKFQGFNITGS